MKRLLKHVRLMTQVLLVSSLVLMSCKKETGSSGKPSITSFRLYNISPLDSIIGPDADIKAIRPGDMIVIQGENLDDMQAVFFDGFPASINTAYSSPNNFVVTVPGNIPFGDIADEDQNTVTVVTAGGSTTISFPIAAPAPKIISVSNELPNPGEKLTIYGSGLYAITELVLPGDISVPSEDIKSDPGGGSSEFLLPSGFTDQEGTIKIVTKYGESISTVKLNDETGMICDFDDLNIFDAGNSSCGLSSDASAFPGARGQFARMKVEDVPANDWNDTQTGRRLILNSVPIVPTDQLNSSTANWAVKFEVYVRQPWSAGCLFLHDGSWGNTCRYEPWKSSVSYQTTGWTTVTLPLSDFKSKPSSGPTAGIDGTGTPFATLSEMTGGTGNYRLGFFFDNALQAVPQFDIAIDNIRFVRLK